MQPDGSHHGDPRREMLSDRVRLQHMLDAAKHAVTFAQGRTRSDLDADPMFARAVLHAVQEIGEAASRVSDDGRARVPDVPWTKIVGMRHRLVHVYWGVNLNLVWEVVIRDLPELMRAIERGTSGWPLAEVP